MISADYGRLTSLYDSKQFQPDYVIPQDNLQFQSSLWSLISKSYRAIHGVGQGIAYTIFSFSDDALEMPLTTLPQFKRCPSDLRRGALRLQT